MIIKIDECVVENFTLAETRSVLKDADKQFWCANKVICVTFAEKAADRKFDAKDFTFSFSTTAFRDQLPVCDALHSPSDCDD